MSRVPRRALLVAPLLACPIVGRAMSAWDGLPEAFAALERAAGGRLGVAVLDRGGARRAAYRPEERFPLASTFKLLLAGAVLARVDAGQERLDRALPYGRADLVQWSPVTEPALEAGALPVSALLDAILAQSDNTAANLLLGTLGGPIGLTAFLRRLGDATTRLDRIEPALNEARPGDPRDSSTPSAMLCAVETLALGTALADASRSRLVAGLRGNLAGAARLRAGVPPGWQVGDRTGTGGHRTSNVVGVLWPPDDRPPMVVAAFLTEGAAEPTARDAVLAEVARLIAAAA